jgi:hypothetical protein
VFELRPLLVNNITHLISHKLSDNVCCNYQEAADELIATLSLLSSIECSFAFLGSKHMRCATIVLLSYP